MVPPLKVNQHLKICAGGHFPVYPFHVVGRYHQIAREAYERHFQLTLNLTLHLNNLQTRVQDTLAKDLGNLPRITEMHVQNINCTWKSRITPIKEDEEDHLLIPPPS